MDLGSIMSDINSTYEDIQRIQVREDSLNILQELEDSNSCNFFPELVYQLYRQQFSPTYFEMSPWYVGNRLTGSVVNPLYHAAKMLNVGNSK